MNAEPTEGTGAIRGVPVPADCVCSHADVFHYLKAGQRTACSTATGHTGTPCGCKKYVPKEPG